MEADNFTIVDTVHELRLIGAVMVYPRNIDKIPHVESDMFFRSEHADVYAKVAELYDRRTKPTATAILNELGDRYASVIENALKAHPSDGTSVRDLHDKFVDVGIRRRLYYAAEQIKTCAINTTGGGEQVASAIETLSQIGDGKQENTVQTIGAAMDAAIRGMEHPEQHKDLIPTGIAGIDNLNGGFKRGLLYIIGARPSMGKSLFLLNLMVNIANKGYKCFSANLEDINQYVAIRALARFSRVNSQKMAMGTVTPADIEDIKKATAKVARDNIVLDDAVGQSTASLRRKISRMKASGGVDVMFVDHLAELTTAGDEYSSTTKNCQALRDIAKEFNITVVLAAQLNRGEKGAENKIPNMARIRDSGRVEEFARGIWFLHRPAAYDSEADKNHLILRIAKASHGPTFDLDLGIDLPTMEVW